MSHHKQQPHGRPSGAVPTIAADDEFEDFDTEDWTRHAEDADDAALWEEAWDNVAARTDDDLATRLREELRAARAVPPQQQQQQPHQQQQLQQPKTQQQHQQQQQHKMN